MKRNLSLLIAVILLATTLTSCSFKFGEDNNGDEDGIIGFAYNSLLRVVDFAKEDMWSGIEGFIEESSAWVSEKYMDISETVLLMISRVTGVTLPGNSTSDVPYVIGDDKELAISKLNQAGLAEPDIIEKHDENVAYGFVIEQSVEAGNQVDEGTKITLTISIGPAAFDMPNVVGQSKDEAESILSSKGLVVVIEYKKTDAVAKDNVISQSVSAGFSVKRGDEITIIVSDGRETVDVANVVGMTQTEAENALKAQGLKVTVIENYDSNIAAGKVISQSPDAGTAQLPDSKIVIYVSKGKQPITVTYDANGGTVNPGSKSGYLSDAYGALPTPTKAGHTFIGWYSAKSGGVEITANTSITTPSNHSIYAMWKANTYSVSFNSNGGGVVPASKNVQFGSKYGSLGNVSRPGYTFTGWYTAASGGTKVTEDSIYSTASNQTLYAQWKANKYSVALDANGGKVSTASINVTYDSTYGALPIPTKTGYIFVGWYSAKSGGVEVTASTLVTTPSNHSIYAIWEANTYSVSFNSNGADFTPASKIVQFGSQYGSLGSVSRPGYAFLGWYTAPSGGVQVTEDSIYSITSNQTLYAHWRVNSYMLIYDANGGSVSAYSKSVTYGSVYGTLPTPTRDYYIFNGWYTAPNGGAKINSTTTMGAGNTTIYAQWTPKDPSGWVLASNVPSGAQIVDNKWVYDKTTWEWGSWSSWSTTKVTASDTRQVETNKEDAVYKRQYRYGYYYSSYCSYAGGYHTGPNSGKWGVGCTCGGKYLTNYKTTSWSDTRYTAKYNSVDKINYWTINGANYYVEETKNVLVSEAYTKYRYRDKVFTTQKDIVSYSQVTAGGEISNVQHYVRYRVK